LNELFTIISYPGGDIKVSSSLVCLIFLLMLWRKIL